MTKTSVVSGIAMLGTPEAAPDCDCATDASGSIARRKRVVNFMDLPLDSIWYCSVSKRVRPYSIRTKKLSFSEALYEEVPRLHQHLLTSFGGQGHPDGSQY